MADANDSNKSAESNKPRLPGDIKKPTEQERQAGELAAAEVSAIEEVVQVQAIQQAQAIAEEGDIGIRRLALSL